MLGQVDGQPFRTEVTLLPETRVVEWEGQQVETRVSQYAAFLDGRIHEVAYDLYAQADDGSVWYFGEDVFNFKDGAIADTHGTWQAGREGPAAMIMPGDPKAGDVYRPENIPGFVFEEVTVRSVDQRLDGPLGAIHGGLLIEELHMDGGTEDKSFAPGYGEFYTAGGGDVEALALAVPTNAAEGPVPVELQTLQDGTAAVQRAARSGSWAAASDAVQRTTAAWDSLAAGRVPKLVEPGLRADVTALAAAVRDRDVDAVERAAFDVAQSGLDLELRYRPVTDIDLGRFGLWLDRLVVDARAGNASAVNGDLFTLDYIRDRIQHALDKADVGRVNVQLEALQVAIDDADLAQAAATAAVLRDLVEGLAPTR